ncbi:MAG: hypothetical protein M3324_10455 [Actinomycetota bacterium]|nr:hypothetical protein [Actinomycetota bacterium]
MDERQQRQVNEAAEKFAEAIKDSYQALADRSVSAQDLNAQLTQEFFNGVINNLRTQAQNNRALAEDLIEQQRKQQEASQALAQESVNAYMDFLNSMFALPRQGVQTAGQAMREAGGVPPQASPRDVQRGTSPDTPVAPPVEGVAPDAASPPGEGQTPREELPPGEERPERRGSVPTAPPTAREEPPPGEERPGRRTP